MKKLRKLVSHYWALLALGIYLTYCAVIQYSPLPSSFATQKEADRFALHLKFPLIGLSFLGGTSDQPGQTIRMYAVEYPFRGKDRVFVIASDKGVFKVIDDFTSSPMVESVELRNGKLRYLSHNGMLILERDARKTPEKSTQAKADAVSSAR